MSDCLFKMASSLLALLNYYREIHQIHGLYVILISPQGIKSIQYVDRCSLDNFVLVLESKNIYVNFTLSLFKIIIQQAISTSVCAVHLHTAFALGKVYQNCVHFFYKHHFKGFMISLC